MGNKVSYVPYNFARQLNEYLPTAKQGFVLFGFYLFIYFLWGGGVGFVGGEGSFFCSGTIVEGGQLEHTSIK